LANVASYGGGGIYNAGTLTVTGSYLDSNGSGDGLVGGGGILNRGVLTVSNSSLGSNMATVISDGVINPTPTYGGGIENDGTATVSGCYFNSNSANYGGAISNRGSLTVSGSTFAQNDIYGAYTDGGGNLFATGVPQINSLTASAASVTAGSTLTLTANITDPNPNSSITEVGFYDSTGLVGYGTQTSPGAWTLTFSTAGWTSGTYTFSATALDNYDAYSDGGPLATVQVI
jgi:hypothetical protein